MAAGSVQERLTYLQKLPSASAPQRRAISPSVPDVAPDTGIPYGSVILSFDVEEHHRIEAAAGLEIDPGLKTHYGLRLESSTRRLLDTLEQRDIKATFFIVGEIARLNPNLVRDIHRAGHEVASHSWDHRRVHHFTPASFAEDVRRSKDALEQVTGAAVYGFRAPTFSVDHRTSWAIDVLAQLGFVYDSSVFPVRHDRYGVARAPRLPFMIHGQEQALLELPPATLRLFWNNIPVGGGGYFRLFPLFLMKLALRQLRKQAFPGIATLYFHPWEFDPQQARLPLGRVNGFRTYVGLMRSNLKFERLLRRRNFVRAIDVARKLSYHPAQLEKFCLSS